MLSDLTHHLCARSGIAPRQPQGEGGDIGLAEDRIGFRDQSGLVKLVPLLLVPAAKCAEEATLYLCEAVLLFMIAFAAKVNGAVGHSGIQETTNQGSQQTKPPLA